MVIIYQYFTAAPIEAVLLWLWDVNESPPRLVLDRQRMDIVSGSEWIYYYDYREYQGKSVYAGYTRANGGAGARVKVSMEISQLNANFTELTSKASEIQATNNRNTIVSAIQSIQNNTTRRIDVPFELIRPESGLKIYRILLGLYDLTGNPEAPDSPPTITITNIAGDIRISETPMVQFTGQTGQYYYDYELAVSSPLESQIVVVKVIEGGITTFHKRSTEIVDATTEIDAVIIQLNQLTTMVSRVLGLTHENIYVRYTFTGGIHTGSTIELYDSKAHAELHDGTTGLVAKYTLTVSYLNGNVNSHLMVKLP